MGLHESEFYNISIAKETGAKKAADLMVQEKIKALKNDITGLEKDDQSVSKGENGYRSKVDGENITNIDGKKNDVEAEILKKEAEIRALKNPDLIAVKKTKIAEIRKNITDLQNKDQAVSKGKDGYRSKVDGKNITNIDGKKNDVEAEIRENEEKLRVLEAEIEKMKNGGKEKKIKTVVAEKSDDDFVYNGASEGFGGNEVKAEKQDDKIERLTEIGTEGREEISDSEYISKDEKMERLTEVGTEGKDKIADSESIKEKTCEKCGAITLNLVDNFCVKCGNKFEEYKKEIPKNEEELLLEKGYKLGDELTELWSQLLVEDRKDPALERLANCGGDGKQLFKDLIENLDDRVKKESLTEDEKNAILQGEIDIIAVFHGKVEKYIKGYEYEKSSSLMKDLKNIRFGTKEEQKVKLAKFKEKLAAQKVGIAEIQKQLFDQMEKDPNASVEDFLKLIEEPANKLELSDEQKMSFKKGIEAYSRTHQAIAENVKDFINEDTKEIDGAGLYEKFFNRKPEGKIEVILRPAMIYFRIENLDDYTVGFNGGRVGSINDKMRESANKSGGCAFSSFKINGSDIAIAMENSTNGKFNDPVNADVFKHEEQHIFNEIIENGYNPEKKDALRRADLFKKEFGENYVGDKKDAHLKKMNDLNLENRIKDEISAYFIEGRSPEDIRETLLRPSTIYKYGFDYKDGSRDEMHFSDDYIDLVDNGITAYSDLLKAGYSVDNAQGILFVESLSKWPKVVKRMLETGIIKNENPEKPKNPENIDEQEKVLLDAVAELRDLYANTDYHERKAMNQVGLYFKGMFSGNKKIEETNNVAAVRKMYEIALNDLKEYQINKLKEKGKLSGGELQEEVKKMHTYYNCTAAEELYNARTEAKIEALEKSESKFDKVRVGATKLANWYNKKVPFVAKAAFAVAAFAAGPGAIMAGKRMLGAFIMSSTGGMQLDALARGKDKVVDAIESNKIAYNSTESQEFDFDSLKSSLDKKITEVGDKMNTQIMRSYVNKAIAAVGVSVLGYNAVSGLMHYYNSGVTKTPGVFGGLLEKAKTAAASNVEDVRLETPYSDALYGERPEGVPNNLTSSVSRDALHTPAPEDVHGAATGEPCIVGKDSSIEKSLGKYLKAHDVKNPGAMAHNMFVSYMRVYMEEHHDELAKAGKLAEYKEMLATGQVNIQPGAELVIEDSNGTLILRDIKGEIKLLPSGVDDSGRVEKPIAKPTASSTETPSASTKAPTSVAGTVQSPAPTVSDVAKEVLNQHDAIETAKVQEQIASAQERFKYFNKEYENLATDTAGYRDGSPSIDHSHAMYEADEARKAAANTIESLAHGKDIVFKDINAATTNIYKATGYKWDSIKDIDYSNAYADDKLKPIIKEMEVVYKKEFGEKIPVSHNSTFGKWLYRVKEITVKKRLGIIIQ